MSRSMVIRLPVTPAGREALRSFLPFIGDGGPYPDGSFIEDMDFDETGKLVEEYLQCEKRGKS